MTGASRPLVCLDFGGVLTGRTDRSVSPPPGVREVPDPAGFAAAYWDARDSYDLGCAEADYWLPVLAAAGLPAGRVHPEAAGSADAAAWLELAPDSRALLDELAAAGADLALLSNAPHPVAAAIRETDWGALFSELVFSCETGALKPDPAAYAAVSGAGPGTVFFDDRQANVDGAAASGWDGRLWTGAAEARSVLRAAGFPV